MASNSDIQTIVDGFLNYLRNEGKESLLPQIVSTLSSSASSQNRSAVVYSVSEMKEKERRDIEQMLSKSHGVSGVEFAEDRDLIGGLKIVIGNQVLDLSYKAKLDQLAQD